MAVAKVIVRIGFGLSLALVGIAHYQDAATFAEAVGRGLGPLESLGMVWGYVLPGLMVVGGVLMALGVYASVGTMLAGTALLSIPAGLMLKSVLSGLSLNDTMPPAMNAVIWILLYIAAARGFHGTHCHCDVPSAKKAMPMPPARPVAASAKPSFPAKAPVSAPKVAAKPKKVTSKKK